MPLPSSNSAIPGGKSCSSLDGRSVGAQNTLAGCDERGRGLERSDGSGPLRCEGYLGPFSACSAAGATRRSTRKLPLSPSSVNSPEASAARKSS
jgi:hypothetical protein